MTCTPSAFPRHVLAEADLISPGRRRSSDGICGDARHAAEHSDHNPDARGIPHAVDVSIDPGVFDPRDYLAAIVGRNDPRVTYLVTNFSGWRGQPNNLPDVINSLDGRGWRQNGSFKRDHAAPSAHLHVSFTVAAEDSVSPFFVVANNPPVPPPVTTDLGDPPVKITDTTVNLDGQGNGYFDLPGVSDPAVLAWGVIGTPDPQGHGYAPIARVAFTLHGHTDRFVIEGGAPNSRCSVRVTHT